MENISKDMILILQYLLPGFVTAWIFYGLTSYQKPSQFERVVQALIFTTFIQAFVIILKFVFLFIGNYLSLAKWSDSSALILSVIISVLFGFICAYYANNDKLNKRLRKIGITRETSFPSEWFGTFLNNVTFIVLHLKDGRRLYGWPIEWPSVPDIGHFLLVQASWLADSKEIPITGVKSILINAYDVRWVEFMDKTWETKNGKEKFKSSAPSTDGRSKGN
jgi:uncharacterized protein DUF6338